MNALEFVSERWPELLRRLAEHCEMALGATCVAVAIGVPLGLLAFRSKLFRSGILNSVSVLQTVPSLALLSLLLPLLGIGIVPALVALILYALLPIVRATVTGLQQVPGDMLEMADALGLTPGQRFWRVEARYAAPVMLSGIRIASIVSIGIATLSAFIGAGGLGTFINRGLALNNTSLVLLGAIPSALLAVYVDAVFGSLEHLIHVRRNRKRSWSLVGATAASGFLALGVVQLAMPSTGPVRQSASTAPTGVVTVGTKNFTEQLILGEIMAQWIERNTHLQVKRRANLAGTAVLHQALLTGDVDMYAEYTGTGLMSILKRPCPPDPKAAYEAVREGYERKYGVTWLKPLGFANTYALAVRQSDAERNGWKTVSDLRKSASKLRAGFTAEFHERPDGMRGLDNAYGFHFKRVYDLEPTLMYKALRDGNVDVIAAFSTDGRIQAYGLRLLKDDRRFFPPYDAAIVVREATLKSFPALKPLLERLSGTLDEKTMQGLNNEVDEDGKPPKAVAAEFLDKLSAG